MEKLLLNGKRSLIYFIGSFSSNPDILHGAIRIYRTRVPAWVILKEVCEEAGKERLFDRVACLYPGIRPIDVELVCALAICILEFWGTPEEAELAELKDDAKWRGDYERQFPDEH